MAGALGQERKTDQRDCFEDLSKVRHFFRKSSFCCWPSVAGCQQNVLKPLVGKPYDSFLEIWDQESGVGTLT